MTDTHLLKPAQGLCSPAEAAWMIREGRVLLLAGTEAELATMPPGNWIGGTVGHFATPLCGVAAGGQILYADFTAICTTACWRSFDAGDIHEIAHHYPANGFAILLLPGFSQLLGSVAGHIMEYDGLYNLPLMGWVSAVALEGDAFHARPKVFAGGPQAHDERAAVLYVGLAERYFTQLHIANLFAPGGGPEIRFPQPGQNIEGDCLIGGERGNLARYMAEQQIDRRLPLVADQDGALINVSILSADAQTGRVMFLAPVSPALSYRFAEEVVDYEAEFIRTAKEIESDGLTHACICVLHFRYAGLTGPRDTRCRPDLVVPVTFGQIAYTVLNQTFACLTIGWSEEDEKEDGEVAA